MKLLSDQAQVFFSNKSCLILLLTPLLAVGFYRYWFFLPNYGNTDEMIHYIASRFLPYMTHGNYQLDRLSYILPAYLLNKVISWKLMSSFILGSFALLLSGFGCYFFSRSFTNQQYALIATFFIALYPATVFFAGTAYAPSMGCAYIWAALGFMGLALTRQPGTALGYAYVAASGFFASLALASGLQWAMQLPFLPAYYLLARRNQPERYNWRLLATDAFIFCIAFLAGQFIFCGVSWWLWGEPFYCKKSVIFAVGGQGMNWIKNNGGWAEGREWFLILNSHANCIPALALGLGLPALAAAVVNGRILKSPWLVFYAAIISFFIFKVPRALINPHVLIKVDTSCFIYPFSIIFIAMLFTKSHQAEQDAKHVATGLRTILWIMFIFVFYMLGSRTNFMIKWYHTLIGGYIPLLIPISIVGALIYIVANTCSRRIAIILLIPVLFLCAQLSFRVFPFAGNANVADRLSYLEKISLQNFSKITAFNPTVFWLNARSDANLLAKSSQIWADRRYLEAALSKLNYSTVKRSARYRSDAFPMTGNLDSNNIYRNRFLNSFKNGSNIVIMLESRPDWEDALQEARKTLAPRGLSAKLLAEPILYMDRSVFYTFMPITLYADDDARLLYPAAIDKAFVDGGLSPHYYKTLVFSKQYPTPLPIIGPGRRRPSSVSAGYFCNFQDNSSSECSTNNFRVRDRHRNKVVLAVYCQGRSFSGTVALQSGEGHDIDERKFSSQSSELLLFEVPESAPTVRLRFFSENGENLVLPDKVELWLGARDKEDAAF